MLVERMRECVIVMARAIAARPQQLILAPSTLRMAPSRGRERGCVIPCRYMIMSSSTVEMTGWIEHENTADSVLNHSVNAAPPLGFSQVSI